MYFGVDLYSIVTGIMKGDTTLTDYTRAIGSFIGIALPIAVFFNLLVDSRADQNQYRNY